MNKKKSFKVYYLLVSEGTTEFNLFSYITTKRFKEDFAKSNIQFSNKVEIVEVGISGGKLNSAGNIRDFKTKYKSIRERYAEQKRFFVLDKDLDCSSNMRKLIKQHEDIVQFVEYNSEYLLLKFSGKNPKCPPDFGNLRDFRNYCKQEFKKHFGKKASDFKDSDFDLIFSNVEDTKIRKSFNELFSSLSF